MMDDYMVKAVETAREYLGPNGAGAELRRKIWMIMLATDWNPPAIGEEAIPTRLPKGAEIVDIVSVDGSKVSYKWAKSYDGGVGMIPIDMVSMDINDILGKKKR